MSPDKLVHMANQIGTFFATQPREQAADAIADHLRKFWDPRMRAQILKHYAEGGAKLDPLVLAAVAKLAKAAKP
jgi:formate dehydrogenase subunit delta